MVTNALQRDTKCFLGIANNTHVFQVILGETDAAMDAASRESILGEPLQFFYYKDGYFVEKSPQILSPYYNLVYTFNYSVWLLLVACVLSLTLTLYILKAFEVTLEP